jgi:hypothetical protein
LEKTWSTYRIVESGDLLEKLLILLLGVTIRGGGARLATVARGVMPVLRWLEVLCAERCEPKTCSLFEELIYPKKESYESEIPESECDSIFLSSFSKLFSEPELLSIAKCVHSSPHPRDVVRLGMCICSKGVNGRSMEAWLSSGILSASGFLLVPRFCLTTTIFSVANGLLLSNEDARDTLRSRKSSPKKLTRTVIFFVM